MSQTIPTTILIISDTHGHLPFPNNPTADFKPVDILIHCGDLTQESKLSEFHQTLQFLREIRANLKLVIVAGNHDFTLDTKAFRTMVENARPPLEAELVRRTYGDYGEMRKIFAASANAERPNTSSEVAQKGSDESTAVSENPAVTFLDEGLYEFTLQNGAFLRVYASPFTPSTSGGAGDWGVQYHPDQQDNHNFEIPPDTDIVITHGPPRGILDNTHSSRRAGCPQLFQAVALVRPRLHCFGHIHESWGAKSIVWRGEEKNDSIPSHFTHIDHSKSVVLRNVSQLETYQREGGRELAYFEAECDANEVGGGGTRRRKKTLFVNAALMGELVFRKYPGLCRFYFRVLRLRVSHHSA